MQLLRNRKEIEAETLSLQRGSKRKMEITELESVLNDFGLEIEEVNFYIKFRSSLYSFMLSMPGFLGSS